MVRIARWVNVSAIALFAAGTLAACATFPSSQQPVQSSNPSVTYNYRTDQELLRANQNATAYCSPYQTVPRTVSMTNNPDGSKAVLFECVRTTLPAPAPTPPARAIAIGRIRSWCKRHRPRVPTARNTARSR
jgi:hypothetical protein